MDKGSFKMLRMGNNRFHCGVGKCIKWRGLEASAKTGECNYSAMKRHYEREHPGVTYNLGTANNTETHMLYGRTPVADASSGESGTKILYFGVHAPGCNDGSLCCTKVKMMECPEDLLHDLSKSMRTTVNIAYGHEQEQYESMPHADAPESDWQLIGPKRGSNKEPGHKDGSKGVAAKAAQLAMGVRCKQ